VNDGWIAHRRLACPGYQTETAPVSHFFTTGDPPQWDLTLILTQDKASFTGKSAFTLPCRLTQARQRRPERPC